jgi:hypothetical protein
MTGCKRWSLARIFPEQLGTKWSESRPYCALVLAGIHYGVEKGIGSHHGK